MHLCVRCDVVLCTVEEDRESAALAFRVASSRVDYSITEDNRWNRNSDWSQGG